MLSLFLYFCKKIYLITKFPPIYIWSSLISVGFIASCIALFYFIKQQGASISLSFLACLLYLSSPAISDIASRSEENILFHTFFILSLLAIINYLKNNSFKNLLSIFLLSLLVAAQHVQPFLIIVSCLFLYLCFSLIKFKQTHQQKTKPIIITFIIFSVTGFAYYIIMHYLFYNPMIIRSYSNNFFSIFNNDSLFRYLQAFLLFAQGYLLTGETPYSFWANNAVHPKGLIYLLGFTVIVVSLVLTRSKNLTNFALLPALGFPFIYEPSSSERWDTFVLILIICIISPFIKSKNINYSKYQKKYFLLIITILILNSFALSTQLKNLKISIDEQSLIKKELNDNKLILTDLDSARIFVKRAPRNSEFKNIQNSKPQPKDGIFLKDSKKFIEDKFNLNCKLTKIIELCVIE